MRYRMKAIKSKKSVDWQKHVIGYCKVVEPVRLIYSNPTFTS